MLGLGTQTCVQNPNALFCHTIWSERRRQLPQRGEGFTPCIYCEFVLAAGGRRITEQEEFSHPDVPLLH